MWTSTWNATTKGILGKRRRFSDRHAFFSFSMPRAVQMILVQIIHENGSQSFFFFRSTLTSRLNQKQNWYFIWFAVNWLFQALLSRWDPDFFFLRRNRKRYIKYFNGNPQQRLPWGTTNRRTDRQINRRVAQLSLVFTQVFQPGVGDFPMSGSLASVHLTAGTLQYPFSFWYWELIRILSMS